MNIATEVIEGTLNSDGTLKLDHHPRLDSGRVTVALRPVGPAVPQRGLTDAIDAIREGQLARGFLHGRTAEEIESGLQEGEEEYEQQIDALRS